MHFRFMKTRTFININFNECDLFFIQYNVNNPKFKKFLKIFLKKKLVATQWINDAMQLEIIFLEILDGQLVNSHKLFRT